MTSRTEREIKALLVVDPHGVLKSPGIQVLRFPEPSWHRGLKVLSKELSNEQLQKLAIDFIAACLHRLRQHTEDTQGESFEVSEVAVLLDMPIHAVPAFHENVGSIGWASAFYVKPKRLGWLRSRELYFYHSD